jgi:hypothetical protein
VIPLSGVLAGPAAATTFDVTSNADSGASTLRQALADAATNPGDDEIDIQVGLPTITVTSELSWSGNGAVTINGNGATVAGPGVARGLVDDGGDGVTMNDLTVTGFGAAFVGDAAPIVSEGGPLSINECDITGNTATSSDGDAGGGANSEGGNVVVALSDIIGNTASATFGDAAGGVLSEGGAVTVRDSTINCNSATADGDAAGGILAFAEGIGITINGSTVVGNSATGAEESANSLLAPGSDITGESNTISDDTSACAAPPPPPPPPPGPGAAPAAAVTAPARFTG